MKPSNKFYRVCYHLVYAVFCIFYRLRVYGKENIPEGAAMVCANHSSMIDPFLIALAFGIKQQVHVIAKIELFRIPVISPILRKLGMISVNRKSLDTSTVKSALSYFKNEEIVVIFPEGTRISKDNVISAKTGAVKIAEHAGVPLVPLFIPRKKPLFNAIPIVIGKSYFIEKQTKRRTMDDYTQLADNLMDRIKSLNTG